MNKWINCFHFKKSDADGTCYFPERDFLWHQVLSCSFHIFPFFQNKFLVKCDKEFSYWKLIICYLHFSTSPYNWFTVYTKSMSILILTPKVFKSDLLITLTWSLIFTFPCCLISVLVWSFYFWCLVFNPCHPFHNLEYSFCESCQ